MKPLTTISLTAGLLFVFCGDSLAQSASIKRQCRDFAAREYPKDAGMQGYIYEKQINAYRYLRTVKDPEVKSIALREYPSDFSMQKYIYNKQLSAKEFMRSIPSSAKKLRAQRSYPEDYTMQRYEYGRL